MRQGIFLPESAFSADPLTVSLHPIVQSHALPSVGTLKTVSSIHVRVRWIMETLKHPACIVGCVARLCRSLLSPGKATRISHWRNPKGTKYSCNLKPNKHHFSGSQWTSGIQHKIPLLSYSSLSNSGPKYIPSQCLASIYTISIIPLTLHPQWGAADAEIKVPSGENT